MKFIPLSDLPFHYRSESMLGNVGTADRDSHFDIHPPFSSDLSAYMHYNHRSNPLFFRDRSFLSRNSRIFREVLLNHYI